MPKNPGNTGHRYRMPRILSVEARDGVVHVHTECGHDYTVSPQEYWPFAKALTAMQECIGKRVRCQQCKKEM